MNPLDLLVPPVANIDAALTRALPGRPRLADGSFVCGKCDGDGEIDVCYGHPNDSSAPGGYEECPDCHGRRCEECCGCGAPARIEGADPDYLYCSLACAEADGNTPETPEAWARHRFTGPFVGDREIDPRDVPGECEVCSAPVLAKDEGRWAHVCSPGCEAKLRNGA